MSFLRFAVNSLATTFSRSLNLSATVSTSLVKSSKVLEPFSGFNGLSAMSSRCMSTLRQMHRKGPHHKKRSPKRVNYRSSQQSSRLRFVVLVFFFQPLDGKPFAKGVILKTLIKKPKKPNSANRKCVLVRLSTGKEMVAYIPGEGHNLQEHNIVLVRCGRLQDVPGVKLKCVRGKYDLGHVIKK